MRNARQGTTGKEEGDNVTMQQLMETIRTLQQIVEASKADQERVLGEVRTEQALRQDQFRVELDASRTDNEDLRRANEELRRYLQRLGERVVGEQSPPIPIMARPMPFS